MAFERIPGAAGVATGGLSRVTVGGLPVCVARTRDGRLFAVSDICSHRAVPLSQGHLSGKRIHCPLHDAAFDLVTGEPTSPPARTSIPTYRVVEDGEDLLIAPGGTVESGRRTRWPILRWMRAVTRRRG